MWCLQKQRMTYTLCIALFATTEGWLLLNIGWFVLFLHTDKQQTKWSLSGDSMLQYYDILTSPSYNIMTFRPVHVTILWHFDQSMLQYYDISSSPCYNIMTFRPVHVTILWHFIQYMLQYNMTFRVTILWHFIQYMLQYYDNSSSKCYNIMTFHPVHVTIIWHFIQYMLQYYDNSSSPCCNIMTIHPVHVVILWHFVQYMLQYYDISSSNFKIVP